MRAIAALMGLVLVAYCVVHAAQGANQGTPIAGSADPLLVWRVLHALTAAIAILFVLVLMDPPKPKT